MKRRTLKQRFAQSFLEAIATVAMAAVLWCFRPDLAHPWTAFLVTLGIWTAARIIDGFVQGVLEGMAP